MISFHAFQSFSDAELSIFRWDSAQDKLGYVPTRNLDANHCESYVDGTLGRAYAHNGASNDTLTFYFHVNRASLVEEQHGQILNLAAYVREPEGDYLVKATDDIVSLCLAVQVPDRVPYSEVIGFAFFLDTKNADGSIDRLWLKNSDRNFTIDDIRKHRITGNSLGSGSEYYVAEHSPLFNQKRACRR
jgi:hypothetical protein